METQSNNIPVGLAPMEGVTDFPVRAWFRLVSAPDFVCTPFLRVTPTYPTGTLPEHFLPESDTHLPTTLPQLMAADVEDFLRVAGRVIDRTGTIDINCGCPAPLAVGAGAGSSILRDPELFHQMAGRLQSTFGNKAGIKMRTGYDDDLRFAELIAGVAAADLPRLTIHGRTRAQGYTGQARWDLIAQASTVVKAPVWTSGDIVDLTSWQVMRDECPQIRGAIIGRGALRNPWIFREIREGEPVHVTADELTTALACLAQMLMLFKTTPGRFAAWCAEPRPACLATNDWQRAFAELSALRETPNIQVADIELDRFALGRVKMLWNYLRSSLPEPWFAPQTFRQKTGRGFFTALQGIAPVLDAPIALHHQKKWDGLYSGASRAPRVRRSPNKSSHEHASDRSAAHT